MQRYILFFILAFTYFKRSICLECYVCKEQDKNDGKCLKTIKTCEPEQDMCLTEIKWGTTPYWQAGAQKQFYISKYCASKHQCDRIMRRYMTSCTHVWYEDWKCAECCGGDKCNYFIISASERTLGLSSLILLSVVSLLYSYRA